MKRIYTYLILSLVLLITGCWNNINCIPKLVEQNKVYYEVNSNTPYTGKATSDSPSWQPRYEWSFKDGRKDGAQISWHANGQKKSETYMKGGELDGADIRWYKNGQKKSERWFEDGNYVKSKSKYWDESGQFKPKQ